MQLIFVVVIVAMTLQVSQSATLELSKEKNRSKKYTLSVSAPAKSGTLIGPQPYGGVPPIPGQMLMDGAGGQQYGSGMNPMYGARPMPYSNGNGYFPGSPLNGYQGAAPFAGVPTNGLQQGVVSPTHWNPTGPGFLPASAAPVSPMMSPVNGFNG